VNLNQVGCCFVFVFWISKYFFVNPQLWRFESRWRHCFLTRPNTSGPPNTPNKNRPCFLQFTYKSDKIWKSEFQKIMHLWKIILHHWHDVWPANWHGHAMKNITFVAGCPGSDHRCRCLKTNSPPSSQHHIKSMLYSIDGSTAWGYRWNSSASLWVGGGDVRWGGRSIALICPMTRAKHLRCCI
jgi:hypothetical protein